MRKISDSMVYMDGAFHFCDLILDDGRIVAIEEKQGADDIRCSRYIFPGFVDVHVHLRQPGFSYKETIKTGSEASAHGGYTTVCAMPNLNPVPDCMENLQAQLDIIKEDACIHVLPDGTITKAQKGEALSDMEAMAPYVAGFSDDGKGVQHDDMMREAMLKAKALGKMITAHCEDESLLYAGYIHDGEYAKAHGHRGICSESEWGQVKRDLELVRQLGGKYHVCHISTKETVELIRQAKAEGLDVSCETGPHYLVMNDSMLQEDGRFKMNPPIRSEEDRKALVEGIVDGTIDAIATDHAPHSAEEKSRGLEKSLMGVVGIETSFAVLYTELVRGGVITLEKLVDLMSTAPAKRFGLDVPEIKVGNMANLCIWDLDAVQTIDEDFFLSMGKATPFLGWTVMGKCLETICDGKTVYEAK